MPYKIVNVSLAHEHAMKRRSAAKMHMEPVIAGQRLLLRSSRVLTDEQYMANETRLKEFAAHGVITIHPMKPAEEVKVEKKVEPPVKKEAPPAPPTPPAPEPAKAETPPASSEALPPPPPPAPEQQQPRKDGKKQGR